MTTDLSPAPDGGDELARDEVTGVGVAGDEVARDAESEVAGDEDAGDAGSEVAGDAGSDVAGDAGSEVAGDAGSEVAGDAGSEVVGEVAGDADDAGDEIGLDVSNKDEEAKVGEQVDHPHANDDGTQRPGTLADNERSTDGEASTESPEKDIDDDNTSLANESIVNTGAAEIQSAITFNDLRQHMTDAVQVALMPQVYSYTVVPVTPPARDDDDGHSDFLRQRHIIASLLRDQLSLAFAGCEGDSNHLIQMDTDVFEATLVALHNRICEQLFPRRDDESQKPDSAATGSSTIRARDLFEYFVPDQAETGNVSTEQSKEPSSVESLQTVFSNLNSQDRILAASQLPSDLTRVFSVIDTNDDGEVSQEEFVAFVQEHAQKVVEDTVARHIPQDAEARVHWCLAQLQNKHNERMDRYFALHVLKNLLLKYDDVSAGRDMSLLSGVDRAAYEVVSDAFCRAKCAQHLWYFCLSKLRVPASLFERSEHSATVSDSQLARMLANKTSLRDGLEKRVAVNAKQQKALDSDIKRLQALVSDAFHEVKTASMKLQEVVATCHDNEVPARCVVADGEQKVALQQVYDASGTVRRFDLECEVTSSTTNHDDAKADDDVDTEGRDKVALAALRTRESTVSLLKGQDKSCSPMSTMSLEFQAWLRNSLVAAQKRITKKIDSIVTEQAARKQLQQRRAAIAKERDEQVQLALDAQAKHERAVENLTATTTERTRIVQKLTLLRQSHADAVREHEYLCLQKAERDENAQTVLAKQADRMQALAERPHIVGFALHRRHSSMSKAAEVKIPESKSPRAPSPASNAVTGDSSIDPQQEDHATLSTVVEQHASPLMGSDIYSKALANCFSPRNVESRSLTEQQEDDEYHRAIVRARNELSRVHTKGAPLVLVSSSNDSAQTRHKKVAVPKTDQSPVPKELKTSTDISPLAMISDLYFNTFKRVVQRSEGIRIAPSKPTFAYRCTNAEKSLALAVLDLLSQRVISSQEQSSNGSTGPSEVASSPNALTNSFQALQPPALDDLIHHITEPVRRLVSKEVDATQSDMQDAGFLDVSLRFLALLLYRGSNPDLIELTPDEGSSSPCVESAGAHSVVPLVKDESTVKLFAPLIAAAVSLSKADFTPIFAQTLFLARFILSRFSTAGLQRVADHEADTLKSFPGAHEHLEELLTKREEEKELARQRALAARMAHLKAKASAAAAVERVKKAAAARKIRDAAEAAAKRRERAKQIKAEAIQRREEEAAHRRSESLALERRRQELKRVAKERAKAKAAEQRRAKALARRNKAAADEALRRQRAAIHKSLKRSRNRRRKLDRKAARMVAQEMKKNVRLFCAPSLFLPAIALHRSLCSHLLCCQNHDYFHNGMDGGRIHAPNPEWIKKYGQGNARPTVKAYADFRRDGPVRQPRRSPALPSADRDDESGPRLPPVHSSPDKTQKSANKQSSRQRDAVKLPPI